MLKNILIVKLFSYIILALIATVFIASCQAHIGKMWADRESQPIRVDGELKFVNADGLTLSSILVEIADTPDAQAKGLMGRDSLDDHYGMLFVFAEARSQRFHMRNTRIPLDIIFIDAKGCICDIFRNAAPLSKRIYQSSGPIKFAVEVEANYTQHFNIDRNACIQWRRF